MKKNFKKSEIKNILKIKDPFLMIDKVKVINQNKIVEGQKKIKKDDWFLKSHFFNNDPVMPGTLLTEAMLQTTIINLYEDKKKIKKYFIVKSESNYFFKISKTCTLKIVSKILSKKNGIIIAHNTIYLKDRIVSNGKFKYIDPVKFNLNKL